MFEGNILKENNSLRPSQIREIFLAKGWSNIIGFHTRNVIHRSHEFLQIEGLRKSNCDGLLVNPVIGKKKEGDFKQECITKSYQIMMKNFYPKGKVLFSPLNTYSRYAGPREALFTAIIRKNYGCSHFIVGGDHTGVKNFYNPNASHDIFNKFTQEELGIIPSSLTKYFILKRRDAILLKKRMKEILWKFLVPKPEI